MLSERQLETMLGVFRQRAQSVTDHYLTRVGEHLREIGALAPSDVNLLVELQRMNYNMEAIKREIAKIAQVSVADVDRIFAATAESDLRFANRVFASDHSPAVKDNPYIERILKAQARITQQELANLSQTTLLSDGYRTAVDTAVQTVQTGVTDYNSAIRRALKSVAGEGLRVKYPSGYSRRLDTAIRQNILDGIRAINQDVLRQVGKEFRADGIELSAHALCAEDHLPYQGLQMSIRDFERLQNRLDRPFGLWNCRHSWHYIILGVSEHAYSPEELESYKQHSREEITIDGVTKTRYQWTQEQRRIETAIRQQKDIAVMARASGDMVARRECAAMIRELDKYYGKITDGAGLLAKPERMRVAGFSAVKPANELKKRTEYGTMKPYSTMLSERKIISKSDAIRKLPITGDPDSITDFLNEAGDSVLQRRIYDFEGKAAVDFDTSNHDLPKHHPTGAHKHIFDYSKKNPHGPAIPLSEVELKQNKDIVQKGVNYFDPE